MMDRTELKVWICYGCFVVLGLAIFITISCIVRAKNRTCEKELAFVTAYNARVAKGYAENGKIQKIKKSGTRGKESFSLFNLLS